MPLLQANSGMKTEAVRRPVAPRCAMALMLTAAVMLPRPAQACPAMLMGYASASTATITAYITAMSTAFSIGYLRYVDAITRLANQDSNNDQSEKKAAGTLADRAASTVTETTMAQKRVEITEQFIPSRVVCGIATGQLRVASSMPNYTAVRAGMAQSNTVRSLNGPGSGTERGTLHAMTTVFKNRCDRYANVAVLDIPSGITCPGPSDTSMIDLDIKPWNSILQPLNIDTPELKQAAADTVILLTEPAPPDPVRGPMLTRQEGQSVAVARMRDVTRMNVARDALEDIVSMRTTAAMCSSGDNSRLARYVELITGQKVTGNTVSGQMSMITAAGEAKNANIQAVAARLASQKMMLMEFLRLTDHMVTMEAISLAIKAEETRGGSVSIAARPVNN